MTTDCPCGSDEARTIRSDADRLGREVPSLAPLLDAFAPLMAGQAKVQAEAPGWTQAPPAFDPETFCQGKHLLADAGFMDIAPAIPGAAKWLLPIMASCFPGLAGDIGSLERAFDLDPERATAGLLEAALEGSGGQDLGAEPDSSAFIGRELARPLLRRQAQSLFPLIEALPWRYVMCPVCGGHPDFSRFQKVHDDAEFITGHGGPRFLRCGECATWWRYKRVSCPGCGNEEPSRLSFLRNPARPYERLDVCESCSRYVPCLDTTEMIHVPHPDVAVLALMPLEIAARKDSYVPLSPHPWGSADA